MDEIAEQRNLLVVKTPVVDSLPSASGSISGGDDAASDDGGEWPDFGIDQSDQLDLTLRNDFAASRFDRIPNASELIPEKIFPPSLTLEDALEWVRIAHPYLRNKAGPGGTSAHLKCVYSSKRGYLSCPVYAKLEPREAGGYYFRLAPLIEHRHELNPDPSPKYKRLSKFEADIIARCVASGERSTPHIQRLLAVKFQEMGLKTPIPTIKQITNAVQYERKKQRKRQALGIDDKPNETDNYSISSAMTPSKQPHLEKTNSSVPMDLTHSNSDNSMSEPQPPPRTTASSTAIPRQSAKILPVIKSITSCRVQEQQSTGVALKIEVYLRMKLAEYSHLGSHVSLRTSPTVRKVFKVSKFAQRLLDLQSNEIQCFSTGYYLLERICGIDVIVFAIYTQHYPNENAVVVTRYGAPDFLWGINDALHLDLFAHFMRSFLVCLSQYLPSEGFGHYCQNVFLSSKPEAVTVFEPKEPLRDMKPWLLWHVLANKITWMPMDGDDTDIKPPLHIDDCETEESWSDAVETLSADLLKLGGSVGGSVDTIRKQLVAGEGFCVIPCQGGGGGPSTDTQNKAAPLLISEEEALLFAHSPSKFAAKCRENDWHFDTVQHSVESSIAILQHLKGQ